MSLKPTTPPMSPVITTMAAVSDGMPPSVCVTSIAMGVVTDLLASDATTSREAPSMRAVATTLMMPTMHPIICEASIGNICFLICDSCRYSGTPRATTAGFSQNSIICPLLW